MLLSDRDLLAAIAAKSLQLDPYDPVLVQPCSVDVRLDRRFLIFNNHRHPYVDALDPPEDLTELVDVSHLEPFILHPGEFVLGSTLETVAVDDRHAARLEGRSSLGRLGLLTHATAGWIDAGFSGQVTLELSNVATLPIRLWPGMTIGQLCVFRLSSPAEKPYGTPGVGRYQHQQGPTPARTREVL